MIARRSDNRRRRIFVDSGSPETTAETLALSANSAKGGESGKATVLYAAGAERRHQNKTTDLIPKRLWAVISMVGGLMLIVIILNLIAYYSPDWEPTLGIDSVEALRLTGRGTIAAWFSSMLFIVSGLASLQIYALRQHRRDDYRGSYRIWLWMSALFILASANCVVDLGSIGMNAVQAGLQWSGSSSAGIYWMFTAKMVLMSMLIARGIFEIRESRATLAIVSLVWVAYLGASILQLPNSFNAINQLSVQQQDILTGNLYIVAVVGLFLAQLVFARFIYLQATGLVKSKQKKQAIGKSEKKSPAKPKFSKSNDVSAKTETDKQVRSQPSTTKKVDSKVDQNKEHDDAERNRQAEKEVQPESDGAENFEEQQDENKLILQMSKAERRRQRKTVKENRRAA